jgi:hypothetical protein
LRKDLIAPVFELDFVHFSVRFSQSFDLQWVTDVGNGLFKPIADISNPLQVKILQNSHRKMYKVELNIDFGVAKRVL